jgi:deoxyribodipyrimidine photo-lyase
LKAFDMPSIYWFRRDLRLSDNKTLIQALTQSECVIPVYIHCDESGMEQTASASDWWLHHSLTSLNEALVSIGSRLIVRMGNPEDVLSHLCRETGASRVFCASRVESTARNIEESVNRRLAAEGNKFCSEFNSLLWSPAVSRNAAGKPFQVFTPFWKSLQASQLPPPAPLSAPSSLGIPAAFPQSLSIEDLNLLPGVSWDSGFYACWKPGEEGAHAAADAFIQNSILEYKERRDFPSETSVSRLSPHLAFGEISPAQIVWKVICRSPEHTCTEQELAYIRQLAWRDFAAHLLYHFPHTLSAPLRPEYSRFPWKPDAEALLRWQRGETGYPMVDAGMRELWSTGWMHNRVRMIVASFLVKDLLISWQEGAAWFWDTLVDADAANNTLGWQWTAGCGADAAPYFRIFNPISQGQKFDPQGDYIRKWVPELANLPTVYIHQPWMAPTEVLHQSGVSLGVSYPYPMIDHHFARQRALEALSHVTGSGKPATTLEGVLNL